ncbi:MAG: response regulator, partial [Candidatus Obscuribacterales bacterium]|nr:response regulator [Candidatus Obscuribacterales bacterium]
MLNSLYNSAMAKILIVEDEIDLAIPIAQYLGEENHLVEICSNGQDALERLRVYQYDLLILDWMLPGVSGVDICRKFRSQGGDTP